MKQLTCKDLGGPSNCEALVEGETFEELGNNCKEHVMAEVKAGDEAHQAAVTAMMEKSKEEQQAAFAEFQKKFEEAPVL